MVKMDPLYRRKKKKTNYRNNFHSLEHYDAFSFQSVASVEFYLVGITYTDASRERAFKLLHSY